VFSNWIPIRRQIERAGLLERKNVELDLSETELVDHSVMDKLHEMENDFEQQGLSFRVVGLDAHQPFADHAHAARRKGLCLVQRLTVVADPDIERMLESRFLRLGASGFTTIPCVGVGRHDAVFGDVEPKAKVRIEVIAPKDVCELLTDFLSREVQPQHRLTYALETVQVARLDPFKGSMGDNESPEADQKDVLAEAAH
jgi:MFS superfamily sulfate permease-like transporter